MSVRDITGSLGLTPAAVYAHFRSKEHLLHELLLDGHVGTADSVAFFNALNVGDEVQVGESLDKVKGGFYGVNKIDPPTKSEQEAAAKRLAEAKRKAAGLPPTPEKKDDDKKSDDKDDKDKKDKDKKD